MNHKDGENRLAQSEKIRSTSKSTTYYNYLNNRMSVRIKYGNDKPSLAKRLIGAYGNKNANLDQES